MAATILVRKLDSNGDPMRGSGASNFASDIDAVAQIIATRLRLLAGEWFENLNDGTPVFQSMLGVPTTAQAVALVLRDRILGSPYVTRIDTFQLDYGPSGRTLRFSAVVKTQFGPVTISSQPA